MTIKLKSILILSVLLLSALFYASCKKTETARSDAQTASESIAAGKVAQSLYNSLTGGNGGKSVNQPATSSYKGIKVNITQCDDVIDSAINYTTNIGDTIRSTSTGHFNYRYICDNSQWNTIGYQLTDSTHTLGTAPSYDFLYMIRQNYTALTANGNYGTVTVNGSQTSSITITSKKASVKSSRQDNSFDLRDVIVIRKDHTADIISGMTYYDSYVTTDGNKINYSGWISFIGNHKARVSILNGIKKTFAVDLLTGQATALD